jgi:hypothetical protein
LFREPAFRYENSRRKANSFSERPVVTVVFPHQAAGGAKEMLLFRGSSCLQESHFAQATQVPFGLAKLRCQKCLDQVPSYGGSNRAATHTKDIQVIILDPLPSREMVVDYCTVNTWNLIGAN